MKSVLNHRTAAAFLHDLCAIVLAWWLAFLLRFNFELPADYALSAVYSLSWVVPLFGILFFVFGLYRGIWRYASLSDLQHLAAAESIGGLLLAAIAVQMLADAIKVLSNS